MHSATEAAKVIGASKRTVTRLCSRHGIGVIVGKSLVLNDDDIEQLRGLFAGGPGNPEMRTSEGQGRLMAGRRRAK